MERLSGIIGMAALIVIVIVGILGAEGSALRTSSSGGEVLQATRQPEADHGAPAPAVPRFSEEGLRRAITEHEWNEMMQERCIAPSYFAVPAPWPPAC